jgi:chemotaxis protein CheX
MSTPKLSPEPNGHEAWLPVLQLATEEVFETMLNSKLELSSPPASEEALEITAMVGLAGAMCGVLTIRCNAKAGTNMASKMLGIDTDQAASQICDAMGEICNMVAGNFKNKISGMGDGCMLSVPTVITGNDYSCHSLGNSSSLQASFRFDHEMLLIALEIQA